MPVTELKTRILAYLKDVESISSVDLASSLNEELKSLEPVLTSLFGNKYVVMEPLPDIFNLNLTEEGKKYLASGPADLLLFKKLQEEGPMHISEVNAFLNNPKLLGSLKSKKIVEIKSGKLSAIEECEYDESPILGMKKLQEMECVTTLPFPELENYKDALVKLGMLNVTKIKNYNIIKGEEYQATITTIVPELTADHIISNTYNSIKLRLPNYNCMGPKVTCGAEHPLMMMRNQIRKVMLTMGFEEMDTTRYVESSFWNFDTLYQPQHHPARDAQDTFFIDCPSTDSLDLINPDYIKNVQNTHTHGMYGSTGWGYDWSINEAQKNIMRTHTTAVSSRTLYKVAQEYLSSGETTFKPRRFFSIDKVFRNESVDHTHLAEFFQIEGFIIGKDLSLGNLIGTLKEFFAYLNIFNLRFKPAYNPYTEPSMEVFGFHAGLNKWIEIGNSGVFRPEMLRPMGLPEDISVIAWGLSLERPTMITYGISNIRDLIGPKVTLTTIRSSIENHLQRNIPEEAKLQSIYD